MIYKRYFKNLLNVFFPVGAGVGIAVGVNDQKWIYPINQLYSHFTYSIVFNTDFEC